jgi:spore coat protein U-like protein
MKNILKLAVAGLTSLVVAIPSVQAATVAGNFNVTVTLTSLCTVAAIGDLAFGTYTAFQGTVLTATPVTATLTCTRGLTGVTANFDTGTNASDAGAGVNASGAGVVAGLYYTVVATAGAVTAGTAATTGSIGTADSRSYTISGNMPSRQAGTASTGVQTQVRTLTITY